MAVKAARKRNLSTNQMSTWRIVRLGIFRRMRWYRLSNAAFSSSFCRASPPTCHLDVLPRAPSEIQSTDGGTHDCGVVVMVG